MSENILTFLTLLVFMECSCFLPTGLSSWYLCFSLFTSEISGKVRMISIQWKPSIIAWKSFFRFAWSACSEYMWRQNSWYTTMICDLFIILFLPYNLFDKVWYHIVSVAFRIFQWQWPFMFYFEYPYFKIIWGVMWHFEEKSRYLFALHGWSIYNFCMVFFFICCSSQFC